MKKEEIKTDYSIISNHALRNKNLSLKAKGLYCLLCSLPTDWDFSVNGIISICQEGRDSIYKILKELEQNGYIKKYQKNNGKFGKYEYEILGLPLTDFPYTELPYTDLPDTEKPTQLNTKRIKYNKELNNNLIKRKNIKKEKDSLLDEIESQLLKNALLDFVEMRKNIKAPLTKRALEMVITKLNKLSTNEEEQVEILNQSTINNWKSVYPLKKQKKEFKPLMEVEEVEDDESDFDEVAYNQLMSKLKEGRI